MYFHGLATAWHSSNWNVTSFLAVLIFAVTFSFSFWGIMSDPQHLIKKKKKETLHVFRFHDESHPWQTNCTCPSVTGQCYKCSAGLESCLWNQNTTWLKLIPFSPHSHFYYRATFFKILARWFVFESQQGDRFSHLITRQGIWEVSAIKWSGAIK